MIVPGPTDRIDERLGDHGTHEFIVRSQKRVDPDLIEWRDQRIHVDDGNPFRNHPINRLRKRIDLDGLNSDEVPFARRHLVQGGSLLARGESAVEPRDVYVVQPAPELGGLFSLCAPRHLQANVRKGCSKPSVRAADGFADGSIDGRRVNTAR